MPTRHHIGGPSANWTHRTRSYIRYRHSAPIGKKQDVAILTSLTFVEGSEFCLDERGLTGLQMQVPDGPPTWLVSVHLGWPFPFQQFQQSQLVANRIKELEGPVVIAGDFNMVPWGASVKPIAEAASAEHLGAYQDTFGSARPLLPLPIEILLVPEGKIGTIDLRPHFGSDHLGVLAQFSIPTSVE